MKLALTALLGLAGLAAATQVCPTATRTMQNRACNKSCPFSGCTLQTTIANPCGCPSSVPTATLIAPCEADCPYMGCDIDFRVSPEACPTSTSTTSSSTRRPIPTSIRPTTRPTSTGPVITTSIITLPTPTITTSSSTTTPLPCPRVTSTTSPAGCAPIRCPVPTCFASSTMTVPCGCEPRTVLYVTGCATTCADGCFTRTATVSQAC